MALVLGLLMLVCTSCKDAEAARWRPSPAQAWQWQLSGKLDTTVSADVFDVDLFDTPREVVHLLKGREQRTVCYLSAGSWEVWRPDARRFPARVVGRPLRGWPGERWLDIRRLDVLGPILEARLDLCDSKGFDAVEPDNVDGFENDTGFRLTAADQLRFNRWLAREAHARGLAVALKNDLGQARALAPDFDFAVVEECYARRECAATAPFTRAGKVVLAVEYRDAPGFCARARTLGLTGMVKRRSLGPWRRDCPLP